MTEAETGQAEPSSSKRTSCSLSVAAALTCSLLLALLGCAATEPRRDPSMTPDESKVQLLNLISRTIDVVGGGEWTLDESGAADCLTAGGHPGVQFDVQRSADSGALDPELARDAAEKVWTAEGVDSRREVLGREVALILAHRPDKNSFFLEPPG